MALGSRNGYEIDMCSGAILPKLLQFSMPLMCSSVLQLLFNAADIVVVGRFAGDNSLAAVGSTASLVSLMTNLFLGLSVGANILAARYNGARDQEELQKTVHTAMALSLVSGLLMLLLGTLGARQVLVWMQSPPKVLGLSTLYLRIYFLGMPASMLYNFGAAILRAIGDTRRPLYYLFAAGVVNVLLNLFFVIVCRLDVAGVAMATVISQCISAFLVVRCLIREKGGIHLDLRQLRFHRSKLKQILQVGLPAGMQGVLFSLSNVVIQSSINTFGEVMVAGNAAAGNLDGFIYASVNAFYQANISFTSQNLGAGNIRRIRQVALRSVLCGMTAGLVLGVLAVAFGPWLLGLYTSSAAVVAAGMVRLRIIALPYALCGLMDVIVGSIRGMGRAILPMVVTLLGACGLRLVWIATVFQLPGFRTPETIFWSYPVSWAITFLAHLVCFLLTYRHLARRHGESSPATEQIQPSR